MTGQHPNPFKLATSGPARPLLDAVKIHIRDNVEPILEECFRFDAEKTDRRGRGGPGLTNPEDGK